MEELEGIVLKANELVRDREKQLRDSSPLGSEINQTHAQEYYKAVIFLLRCYCVQTNWPNGADSAPTENVPIAVAHHLANQLQHLVAGAVPDSFAALLRGVKKPKAAPRESKSIGIAVAYIDAVRSDILSDQSPIKTVASSYGVDVRTVKRWRQNMSWVAWTDFNFADNEAEKASALKNVMQQEGRLYQKLGRGPVAISNRANKKRAKRG